MADFPLSFVSTAIVFPVVFSIGGAYNRRESALAQYGSMKAHLRCIFMATRDWVPEKDKEAIKRAKTCELHSLVGQACKHSFERACVQVL